MTEILLDCIKACPILYTGQEKILTEDFGKILRENWQLRNIAKYGYFASARLEIKDITISEEKVGSLLFLVKKMFSEFEKYFESKTGGD